MSVYGDVFPSEYYNRFDSTDGFTVANSANAVKKIRQCKRFNTADMAKTGSYEEFSNEDKHMVIHRIANYIFDKSLFKTKVYKSSELGETVFEFEVDVVDPGEMKYAIVDKDVFVFGKETFDIEELKEALTAKFPERFL